MRGSTVMLRVGMVAVALSLCCQCSRGAANELAHASLASEVLVPAESPRYSLLQGVCVDAVNRRLFVMSEDGGVAAISLETGRVRWKSTLAQQPLAITAAGLLALRSGSMSSSAALVLLNADSGAITHTITDGLPTVWSTNTPPTKRALSFVATEADDEFLLRWTLREQAISGIAPVGGRNEPTAYTGMLQVDLVHGEVSKLEPVPPTIPRLPHGLATRLQQAHLTPHLTNKRIAAHERPKDGPRDRVWIYRWDDAGAELPKIEVRGKGLGVRYAASAPAVSVSELIAVGKGYRTRVFALNDGEKLLSVESTVALAEFTVVDSIVVFEQPAFSVERAGTITKSPRLLRAFAAGSGQQLWVVPIYDSRAQAPDPPIPP